MLKYSIAVTAEKGIEMYFSYSATDTIRSLNEWIQQHMGIPSAKQRIHSIPRGYFHPIIELKNNSNELLINRLKNAASINVALKKQ